MATAGVVTVNGTPASSLRSAIDGAQAGDIIMLGAGTFPISETLHIAGGVTVRGAGAGRTIIDATGLPVGVTFGATDPRSATVVDKATVTGAATCVGGLERRNRGAPHARGGAGLRDGGNHGGGRAEAPGIVNATVVGERDRRRLVRGDDDQEQLGERKRGGVEERGGGRAFEQLRRSVREHDGVPRADGRNGRLTAAVTYMDLGGPRHDARRTAGLDRSGRPGRRGRRGADAERRADQPGRVRRDRRRRAQRAGGGGRRRSRTSTPTPGSTQTPPTRWRRRRRARTARRARRPPLRLRRPRVPPKPHPAISGGAGGCALAGGAPGVAAPGFGAPGVGVGGGGLTASLMLVLALVRGRRRRTRS